MSLFLNHEPEVINTMTQVASLPLTVSGSTGLHVVSSNSTDYEQPHAPWHRYAQLTSASTVQTTDINLALCHCTGRGHHHSPLQQYRPRISTWPLVVVQVIHINMALGSSMANGHPHGFRL